MTEATEQPVSEMVGRVAKALWDANDQSFFKLPWDHLLPVAKTVWMGKARAAISAMRTPTEAMVQEGWRCIRGNLRPDEAYSSMVDEALK